MSDGSASGASVDRWPADEAFALLGNETRLEILEALAADLESPRSFSDLREAVGERDSGKFNYHLRKLTDHFVRQSEDGYRLSMAGMQVVGAILAGTYTADATLDPIEVDDPCPRCGSTPLVVSYEDEQVHIDCASCGAYANRFAFPPGTLDQFDRDELPAAMDRWLRALFHRVVTGFCPACSGRMTGELVDAPAGSADPARAAYTCTRCGDRAECSPATVLFYHPGVMGFCFDHGFDVTATASWRLGGDSVDATLLDDDPRRVSVALTMDGVTASAVLEPDLSVTGFERDDR